MELEVCGGRAGYNSVSFTGEKYQSLSRIKDSKIMTETRPIKEDKKIIVILSKIPFVRAFTMIIGLFTKIWKQYLFGVMAIHLMGFLLNGKLIIYFLHTVPINPLVMLSGSLVIAGLVIKVTPIGKYHAAEHMVANAYKRDPNLPFERVKKQSRIHKDCGTNLVVSFFICFFILFMVFGDATWVILVSWSIGYELWKAEPKIIWDAVLAIGKVAQYFLFTSKPNEKHLLVAMEAITKLEEKELALENQGKR